MKRALFIFLALFSSYFASGANPYLTGQDAFEFTYSFTLPKLTAGQAARVWIPMASSDGYQRVEVAKEPSPLKGQLIRDPQFKNLAWLYEILPSHSNDKLTFKYQVLRNEKLAYFNFEKSLDHFLEAEPLVPLDERFKKLAEQTTQSKKTDFEKGRAIYDYVLSVMKYDKTGKGWGRGDAIYACDAKKGNCTDFHALFIAIARAAKIPARFMVGFTIPWDKQDGVIEGYHCWAEFLADGKWIPIDISEASKNPAAKDYYFGHHPANRFEFTRGRNLSYDPMPKEGPINFLVYPYLEIDGKITKADAEYSFRRLTPSETTILKGRFALPSPQGGIVYGDPGHALDWPDELIVKHLEELKESGVSVIFLEHFRTTEQTLLDQFFNNPTDANLKKIIQTVRARNKGFDQIKPGEQVLLKTLAAKRLRPIGIELPKRKQTFKIREKHWFKTIQEYLNQHPDTTWVAYVGNSHLQGDGKSSDDLGLDEKLNVPSIKLDNLTETPQEWRERP